jgi:hypothetical protein
MIEDGEITPEEGAELLQNLGLSDSPEAEASLSNELLDKLDKGEISADEALHLLDTSNQEALAEPEVIIEKEHAETPPNISDQELNRWRRWWMIPMYVGAVIVALSTLWMNSAYQNSGYGFWFFCAWLPLLIGVLFMVLSWRSRVGPWIHVRVNGPNERVAISIPAPLKLTGWALRNFGHYIPQMEHTSVDEILIALEQSAKGGSPLYVKVDEGESGEKVEVFIG